MIRQPIAIIGIGCRFPKANDPHEFWQVIRNGINAITESPCDRPVAMPGWGGFLRGIDKFDAAFFGISPEEAIKIDPQHRFLLEVTWEALEDAGQIPERLSGTDTSIFVGISWNEYYQFVIQQESIPDLDLTTGNHCSMAANRISHHFNFCGLSLAINTACSSSLVAVDRACQSLWADESSLALAAGVNMNFCSTSTSRFIKAGLLAADGLCKTFDAKADGYIRGEGVGVVVLKLLSQAQADGDRIYAVIRGSGVNHNGSGNGLTAPNMQAQIDLLKKVYRQSNINPSSVDYIEAHGTATLIGDALEMKALGMVVGKDRTSDNPCRVGCVKTNIGHTEASSGLAGLIKVALSIYYRQIPPNLHFQEPNPAISFTKLGLKVQQFLEVIPEEAGSIRAGVSAFGLGGTNAHAILESAPSESKAKSSSSTLQIFTLTAKSSAALQALVQRYQAFLEDQVDVSLGDICFTANTKRSQFQHRLAIITESKEKLKGQLSIYLREESSSTVFSGKATRQKPAPICFIFSGKSDEWKLIIKSFYQNQPAFYSSLERLQPILSSHLGKSFLELMKEEKLENFLHRQVADFICEYAIAQIWQYWGINPTMFIGYGMGTYTALVLAEVLTLEDVVFLILEDKELKSPRNLKPAKFPVVSSITGNTIEVGQRIDYEQWQKEFDFNDKNPLDLSDQLSGSNLIFLDLCSMQIKSPDNDGEISFGDRNNFLYSLYFALVKIWLMGVKIDWATVQDYRQCCLISLPTYPFDRQSYWVNSSQILLSNENNKDNDVQEILDYFRPGFIAPRDDLELQLAEIWGKVLGRKHIGIKDNFFELGGTSLLGTQLFAQIAENFQTDIPLSALYQEPTIEGLAKVLEGKRQVPSWYSLVPLQPSGSRPPLFCFQVLKFQKLSFYLGQDQPVYTLRYGMAEPPGKSVYLPPVEELAAHFIQEMQTVQPQGPYYLLGWSFGGLVAYEIAHQLRAQGQQVALLAVLDTYIEYCIPFVARVFLRCKRRLRRLYELCRHILRLTPAEFWRRVKRKIKSKLGKPTKVDVRPEYFPHGRSDMHRILYQAYTRKSYSGKVTLFKATDVIPGGGYEYAEPPEVGWRKLITGTLEVHQVPGSHGGILEEPNVQVLAKKLLEECLRMNPKCKP